MLSASTTPLQTISSVAWGGGEICQKDHLRYVSAFHALKLVRFCKYRLRILSHSYDIAGATLPS